MMTFLFTYSNNHRHHRCHQNRLREMQVPSDPRSLTNLAAVWPLELNCWWRCGVLRGNPRHTSDQQQSFPLSAAALTCQMSPENYNYS